MNSNSIKFNQLHFYFHKKSILHLNWLETHSITSKIIIITEIPVPLECEAITTISTHQPYLLVHITYAYQTLKYN